MNRRTFLTGSAAAAILIPPFRAAALDVDFIEPAILQVFRLLPGDPKQGEFDFPITTGTNGPLQRSVWPENPDMYWDPEGEDYYSVLGFYPTWMELHGTQAGVSLWKMNPSAFDREVSQAKLESNGWEVVDDDLHILHYGGSDVDRTALAGEMNVLGSWMREGRWDWIALPDDVSIVVGSNEERVRTIADNIKNHTLIESVDQNLPHLRYILRPDAYLASLLPHQRLPMSGTTAGFISRSWTDDVPIIHSVGLCLESEDLVESVIGIVEKRLAEESSLLLGTPYANFLEISNATSYRESVRFDFVDSSGEWDVFHALDNDDLRMVPLPGDGV